MLVASNVGVTLCVASVTRKCYALVVSYVGYVPMHCYA